MPMYTFHLFRADGRSTAFEAHELERDEEATARAQQLLQDHKTCARVAVWQGERKVLEWPPVEA